MKFAVKRYWEMCDTVKVEAASAVQAIEAALNLPLDPTIAHCVPDSLNTDPDADVCPLGGVP